MHFRTDYTYRSYSSTTGTHLYVLGIELNRFPSLFVMKVISKTLFLMPFLLKKKKSFIFYKYIPLCSPRL